MNNLYNTDFNNKPILEFDLAIIGAGAAGVSHAYYLTKINPDLRIAIFEKANHIGGKCYSYIDQQGNAHDMGAILHAPTHRVMADLIQQAGVNYMTVRPLEKEVCSQFSALELLKALGKYAYLCNTHKLPEWDFRDMAADPIRMMSVEELINTYQLDAIREIFECAFKLYGYGELKSILSGIAFSYIDTPLLVSGIIHSIPLLKLFLGKIYKPTGITLTEGFQSVFENLVMQLQKGRTPLQVFFNTSVLSIDSLEKGVIINSLDKRWYAKAAYVTCGWGSIKMPGINKKVRQLFQNLTYEDYGVTVFKTSKPMPYTLTHNYQATELCPLMYGVKFNTEYGKYIGIAYTKGASSQKAEIFMALRNHLATEGIILDNSSLLAQRQVEYYPRFTTKDIQNGAFKTVWSNQGVGNIFFGGALLSFELTESVAAYSKNLACKIAKFLQYS